METAHREKLCQHATERDGSDALRPWPSHTHVRLAGNEIGPHLAEGLTGDTLLDVVGPMMVGEAHTV